MSLVLRLVVLMPWLNDNGWDGEKMEETICLFPPSSICNGCLKTWDYTMKAGVGIRA